MLGSGAGPGRRQGRQRPEYVPSQVPARQPGCLGRLVRLAGLALMVLFALGSLAVWRWWLVEPSPTAHSQGTNALWAAHRWVAAAQPEGDYRALADILRGAEVSDVFFHVGPLEEDGGIPPARYAHARDLLAAMRRLAPQVRAQAYVGQITTRAGGILDLGDRPVRDRIVATARGLLELGFAGIHYDIEPVYPGDQDFTDLLTRTRGLTEARGAVLSVALEDLELVPGSAGTFGIAAWLTRAHLPALTSPGSLRDIAGRVDQIAIMAYDTLLPADWMVGRLYAWQTEQVLRLVGDQATVFIGVPSYADRQLFPQVDNLGNALRGVRRGVQALPRAPRRPYGVAVFAEWTTTPDEWALYRSSWIRPAG